MQNTINKPVAKRTFYERKVLSLLLQMTKGRAVVNLPNNESIAIGNGGNGIEAQITVTDKLFFEKCVLYGDIGFGAAYPDGYWNTKDICSVIKWILKNMDNAPTVSGNRIKEVKPRKGRHDYREVYDLSPGNYVLSEASHPQWICHITITPH